MNKEIRDRLNLASTVDLDAKIKGKWGESSAFREALKSQGLIYDELSNEIWRRTC